MREKITIGCRNCNEPISVYSEFDTTGKVVRTNKDAKWGYYGGLCCSKSCEERTVIDLQSSMPGAGRCYSIDQRTQREINQRWEP